MNPTTEQKNFAVLEWQLARCRLSERVLVNIRLQNLQVDSSLFDRSIDCEIVDLWTSRVAQSKDSHAESLAKPDCNQSDYQTGSTTRISAQSRRSVLNSFPFQPRSIRKSLQSNPSLREQTHGRHWRRAVMPYRKNSRVLLRSTPSIRMCVGSSEV